MTRLEMTAETEFLFMRQNTSVQAFADEFCEGDVEHAKDAIQVLIRKGKVTFPTRTTKQEKMMMHVAKEEVVKEVVEQFEQDDLTVEKYKRDDKRENKHKYESIELPFPLLANAQETQKYVQEKFFLETRIEVDGKLFVLHVFNITDSEINAISRKYQLEGAIDSTVKFANKGVTGVADAVDFTASRILVPTFKVGANAGFSVVRTTASTLAKTSGVLVSGLIKGTKQAKKEITTDREVLTAVNELTMTKDSIVKGFNKMFSGVTANSSIKINR